MAERVLLGRFDCVWSRPSEFSTGLLPAGPRSEGSRGAGGGTLVLPLLQLLRQGATGGSSCEVSAGMLGRRETGAPGRPDAVIRSSPQTAGTGLPEVEPVQALDRQGKAPGGPAAAAEGGPGAPQRPQSCPPGLGDVVPFPLGSLRAIAAACPPPASFSLFLAATPHPVGATLPAGRGPGPPSPPPYPSAWSGHLPCFSPWSSAQLLGTPHQAKAFQTLWKCGVGVGVGTTRELPGAGD